MAVRRDEEQRGDRVPRRAGAEERAAAAAARREAEGPGIVLRDRGRRAGRPERDPRLPGLVGAGAAPRARARVAEAGRHRSGAPDVRLRRRAGAGGGRRLAAHPRRLRAAVRSRRHRARRDHAGMVGRHLPGPDRGGHRPHQAGRQGLLHRHLRRKVDPRHQAARGLHAGGRRADRRGRGRRPEDRGPDDLGRRRRDQRRPHRHVRRAEGEGGVQGAGREVRHVPGAGHRLRPALRRRGRQGRRRRLRVRRAGRRQDEAGREAGHQHAVAGREPGVHRLPHRELRPARAARHGGRAACRGASTRAPTSRTSRRACRASI